MKQEDKELLLKDLCARLPYGVICYDEAQNENGIFKQFEYEGFGRIHNGRGMRYIEHIHPILRPISSMTEEEKHELLRFGTVSIDKDSNAIDVCCVGFCNHAKVQDYLNSIHIDYRGLIPKGLAIEVIEENNPYKE